MALPSYAVEGGSKVSGHPVYCPYFMPIMRIMTYFDRVLSALCYEYFEAAFPREQNGIKYSYVRGHLLVQEQHLFLG